MFYCRRQRSHNIPHIFAGLQPETGVGWPNFPIFRDIWGYFCRHQGREMEEAGALPHHGPPMNILPPTPAGLEALYSLCRKIYPDQPNPLQVTALLKYWLGGPDPLDYISMYANPGLPHKNIPAHWHYISFGLSDLHGDGRVHDVSGPNDISGFGFELTFRLKREPEETGPPTWPATLMQSLAKYVFQSGNTLCAGDHVSWHCALDNSESRIQHMLMTTDLHLNTAQTPFGGVDFIQIVGICAEELKAAQQWNGAGILNMISQMPSAGGDWHITDMRRGESIFELDLNAHDKVERGFELEGSNLSGVSARCSWSKQDDNNTTTMTTTASSRCPSNMLMSLKDGRFAASKAGSICGGGGNPAENDPNLAPALGGATTPNQINSAIQKMLMMQGGRFDLERSGSFAGRPPMEEVRGGGAELLLHVKKIDGVHLVFNLEAGSLLPLAIRGRVKHGRHFTFKSVLGETAITLVANSVTGTLVDSENPYVAQGCWLQILIEDDLAQDMAVTFQVLANPESLSLPKTFSWPDRKLSITIVADKM